MKSTIFGVLIMLASSTMSSFAQGSPPLNVSEWQSAREILQESKSKVESGWYQGHVRPLGPMTYCLSTALEASFLELRKSLVDFDYARRAVNNAISAPDTIPTSGDDPLSVPYWGRYFVYWNDAPGRTQQEVVDALDKAMSYAENQRNIAVRANRTETDLLNYDANSIQRLGLSRRQ